MHRSVPRLGLLLLFMEMPAAQAQMLVVGFGTHKPPYVFEGEDRGLEFEIVAQAFAQAGMQMQPYYAPLERMHRMLERKELEAMTATNTNSGVKAFHSDVYIEYHNVAVSLERKGIQLERIADLSGHSVSAFQRARMILGDEFRSMALNNPQYREEARQVTRNLLLYADRVDVMIGDRRIIRAFNDVVADRVDVTQPITFHALFSPTAYRVGFSDAGARDRFNEGLRAIRENGQYEAIEARYAEY
ncbi:MAG: substrate-binding periplasmic protein [Pseudomonas sp.]